MLRDYNDHHAATCARRHPLAPNSIPPIETGVVVVGVLIVVACLCVCAQTTFPVYTNRSNVFCASKPKGLVLLTPTPKLHADAYAGQNTQLRDTINNLVEKEPQQWHTGIGLPFRRIEGTVRARSPPLQTSTRAPSARRRRQTRFADSVASGRASQVVEWDEIAFDVRLMNRVPYEGVHLAFPHVDVGRAQIP